MINVPDMEKVEIFFRGDKFYGIEHLGVGEHGQIVVSLYTAPPAKERGMLLTTIAIGEHAGFVRRNAGTMLIKSEYGNIYRFITKSHILDALVVDLKQHGIRGTEL